MSKATTPKKAAKKSVKKAVVEPTEICFVIIPFGSYFDSYYEQIYKPAIEKAGLIARRADDLYRPSAIINDIWHLTKKAKIILADLSTKNPNVFYELGLAHAIKKPAIILTQTMDDVPFDLRGLRVIPYDRMEVNWAEVLKFKIIQSIKEIEESPTISIPPTFLDSPDINKKEIKISEKDFLQLRNDVERLKNSSQSNNFYKSNVEVGKQGIRDFLYRSVSPPNRNKHSSIFTFPLPSSFTNLICMFAASTASSVNISNVTRKTFLSSSHFTGRSYYHHSFFMYNQGCKKAAYIYQSALFR